MEVGLAFPVEFLVTGVPISLQASAASRMRWREHVREALRRRLPEGQWASAEPIAVTIFHFPSATMVGDLDNIAKPILDALCRIAYIDDRQVERLLLRKFEPARTTVFSQPSRILATALEHPRPVTYVRLDTDVGAEG